MPGASVEVRDVSRRFVRGAEEVWALRGVSLRVEPGEFLALIGRSGSGKTTLLNIIGGLDRPTSGEVLIDGERVDRMGDRQLTQLRRRTIGFVFQSFGLLPLLSAEENIELPMRILGWGLHERRTRTRELLEMVGLQKRAHHRPYELSGGEQQRVAIARALAVRPRLLLADEPTGELDSVTAMAIFSLLRTVAKREEVTIIACTHDRLVMEQADRVEELVDGRLASPEERVVWGRVRDRAGSAIGLGLRGRSEERLSSLVAADPSEFRPAPSASPEEETGEDDISRWAPPERRGKP